MPVEEFPLPEGAAEGGYFVNDLLTGERYRWQGRRNYVSLDPHARPAHILRLER